MRRPLFAWGAWLFVALCGVLFARTSHAIDIFNTYYAGIDQPQIYGTFSINANGPPLQADSVDPNTLDPIKTISYQAFLDTGASGLLFSSLITEGFGMTTIQAPDPNNGGVLTDVKFADIGVGGGEAFYVSQNIFVNLGNFQPSAQTETASYFNQQIHVGPGATPTPIHAQVHTDSLATIESPLFGLNVIGMPAMAGKVVVIDPTSADPSKFVNVKLEDLSTEPNYHTFIYNPGTPFHPNTQAEPNRTDTDPGIPSTSITVKLSYGNFDKFSTLTPAGAPGPTLHDNPFIGPNPVLPPGSPIDNTPPTTISFNGKSTTASLLFDTGAAASMISLNKALTLGVRYNPNVIDPDNPVLQKEISPGNWVDFATADQFKLTIGGVGGTKTIAGFYMDSLTLVTALGSVMNLNDPNNLHFVGAPMLVNDITLTDALNQTVTLDGIFGTNYLGGSAEIEYQDLGVFGQVPVPTITSDSPFRWVVFDEPSGELRFELVTTAVPEPSTWFIGAMSLIGVAWMASRASRRKTGMPLFQNAA